MQWKDSAKGVLTVNPRRTLVASWIGINDISDSARYRFPIHNATNFQELYTAMIKAQFASLETVYRSLAMTDLLPTPRLPFLTLSDFPRTVSRTYYRPNSVTGDKHP